MSTKTLSERQRAFSPIDHLRPAGLARMDLPTLQQPHYYRKRERSAKPEQVELDAIEDAEEHGS
jgi:hypothetical protein